MFLRLFIVSNGLSRAHLSRPGGGYSRGPGRVKPKGDAAAQQRRSAKCSWTPARVSDTVASPCFGHLLGGLFAMSQTDVEMTLALDRRGQRSRTIPASAAPLLLLGAR